MNEYENLRADIDRYMMERYKYRKSFAYISPSNVIVARRSKVDLYLRIRRVESLFPPDCLIIARLEFYKERIGHGTHFLRFLTALALKYGFNNIGIECTNAKSSAFAKKFGFYPINDNNYAISVDNIINYFSVVDPILAGVDEI